MRWKKKGQIFNVEKDGLPWMHSHAQIPLAYITDSDTVRIYFCTRMEDNKSRPIYAEYSSKTMEFIRIHETPLLELGPCGTFDDSGIMFSSYVFHGNDMYMYYIGWNRGDGTNVAFRVAIGLAISKDGGSSFKKFSQGPLLDRSLSEPYGVTCPYVNKKGDSWDMWYSSFSGWINNQDGAVGKYFIKHASSQDGIHWNPGEISVTYKNEEEAIARPWVIKENGKYKMWYCYRGIEGFRHDANKAYMIGYAESEDGIHFMRMDDEIGIYKSEAGWDCEAMCYPCVYWDGTVWKMLYNGNEHGKYGFGYAVLED